MHKEKIPTLFLDPSLLCCTHNCKSISIFLFKWKSKFKLLLLRHTCKLHFRLDPYQTFFLACMNYTVLIPYSSPPHLLGHQMKCWWASLVRFLAFLLFWVLCLFLFVFWLVGLVCLFVLGGWFLFGWFCWFVRFFSVCF